MEIAGEGEKIEKREGPNSCPLRIQPLAEGSPKAPYITYVGQLRSGRIQRYISIYIGETTPSLLYNVYNIPYIYLQPSVESLAMMLVFSNYPSFRTRFQRECKCTQIYIYINDVRRYCDGRKGRL